MSASQALLPRRSFVFAAGMLVAIHGAVHLIGFVVGLGIAQVEGFPYRTTALNGSIAMGDDGARVLGIMWLVLAVSFVVAALGLVRGRAWALPVTAALAVVSVIVCVLGLPEAVAGIAVNGAILAGLAYVRFDRGRTRRVSR